MAPSIFIDPSVGENFTGQLIGPAANNTTSPPFTFLGDLTTGYASSAAGVLDLMVAGSKGLELSATVATFLDGVVGSFSKSAIGTTSTTGLSLNNATAATLAVPVQMSPRFLFTGTGWDTDDTVSRPVRFGWQALPVSSTTVTGNLELIWLDPITNAITKPLIISSTGVLVFLGGLTAGGNSVITGNLNVSAGATLYFLGRSQMTSPADGQWNLNDNAGTHGFGFDMTTDAIMKVRTRAQTGYATVDALAYQVSGVAGIDTTITTASLVGKTITVSKGIITGFV